MKFGKLTKTVLLGALFLSSFFGLLVGHMNLVIHENNQPSDPSMYYVLDGQKIKPFLLGHEALLADLIWIRTLGYFADEILSGGKFEFLEKLVNLATDLDPRFESVYIWAGAITMYNSGAITKEKVEASNRILLKGWNTIQNDPEGWRHDPRYWMIPQMLGFNYAIELRDHEKGAPFIAAVARIPESPDLYKTWAATLFNKSGNLQAGIDVLEDVLAIETLSSQLASIKENQIRQRIMSRLNYYYERLYGEDGKKRVEVLKRTLEKLFWEWRNTLPYVSFDLFLLLREDSPQKPLTPDLWSNLFPHLDSSSL